MKRHVYYTVIIGKRSCTVRYAVGPAYEVQSLPGTFASPAEATQEFQMAIEGEHRYLREEAWERQVGRLASRYSLSLD